MKLAAVIVVYKPDLNLLKKNILTLIGDVDHLLLYRNSEINIEDLGLSTDKISFLGSGVNVGISGALNAAITWAENSNSFTHLLTLDQDSHFRTGDLEKFKKLIISEQARNIGIFCPNIDNRGSLLIDSTKPSVDMPDSITSGSIFPMTTFKMCGNFDDKLFIDAVDYEYCYRISTKHGLKTVIYPSIVLNHEVGYPTRIRFGLTTDNYSAFRTYYIVRNQIIIWKRYPHLFQAHYKKTLVKIHIVYRLAKVIIGETDKISKLKSIGLGIIHGLVKK